MDYTLEGLHDDERPVDWWLSEDEEWDVENPGGAIVAVAPIGIISSGKYVGQFAFMDPKSGQCYIREMTSGHLKPVTVGEAAPGFNSIALRGSTMISGPTTGT